MKLKIVASFFLCLLLFGAKQTFAKDQNSQNPGQILSVSPAIIDTQIQKGKTQTYEISLKNLLKEPLGISANVSNFQNQDEEDIKAGQGENSLIEWSKISPEQTIIGSGETQVFKLTVQTPKNLKEGGYYEALILTPFFSQSLNKSAPTVLGKVGILILGTNGTINYSNLAQKTKVESFSFDHLVYDKSQIDTLFKVSNSYFTHFDAKPFLTISPIFGQSQRYELQDKKILPGKIRSWNEEIKPTNTGIFNHATLAVSVGEGNYIYKNSFFFVLPIKPILAILILTILAILVFFRGKQIKQALKILGKGE